MKIVVVDDEIEALNTFLINVVDRTDVQCQMFYNDPKGALTWIRENQADAAFLDIKMPSIDGVTLAEKMIAEVPSIRIFFITSYTFDEEGIQARLGSNFMGFCYKPYDKDLIRQQLSLLGQNATLPFIQTFNSFDVYIAGEPILFKSAKAKELLAFLVNKNGGYARMEETMAHLWPGKEAELSKISYRDASWKLRHVLEQHGMMNLVEFHRGELRIHKEAAKCDLWDLLDGKSEVTSIVSYMPSYEWAVDFEATIMDRLEKNYEAKV